MVVTAGQMQVMLVPRGLTAKELHALLQRRLMPDGNELVVPPALVQHCDSVRWPLRLRDGDTFGWPGLQHVASFLPRAGLIRVSACSVAAPWQSMACTFHCTTC